MVYSKCQLFSLLKCFKNIDVNNQSQIEFPNVTHT